MNYCSHLQIYVGPLRRKVRGTIHSIDDMNDSFDLIMIIYINNYVWEILSNDLLKYN